MCSDKKINQKTFPRYMKKYKFYSSDDIKIYYKTDLVIFIIKGALPLRPSCANSPNINRPVRCKLVPRAFIDGNTL